MIAQSAIIIALRAIMIAVIIPSLRSASHGIQEGIINTQ